MSIVSKRFSIHFAIHSVDVEHLFLIRNGNILNENIFIGFANGAKKMAIVSEMEKTMMMWSIKFQEIFNVYSVQSQDHYRLN